MDTSQRIAAVRAKLRELQKEEQAVETIGPPCFQCIHSVYKTPTSPPVCGHLVYTKRTIEVVTGERKEATTQPAEWARKEDGLCGPEALLFEPLPPIHRIRQMLGY